MTTPTLSKPPISWRRNLVVIWFAELIAIVGFTVVIPLLPLYVRELGVQDENEVRIWAGAVFSVQAVAMAIFGPIWGALSDRYGRKLMVERAMFSGALVIGLMGLVQNVQQLVLLRALQGALTGTVTAANALVATTAPRERVGYALGLLNMAIYTGASIGPLLGGLVADSFGYRMAFFVTGSLLFLAALAVLLFVREEFQPVALPMSEQVGDGVSKLTLRHRIWDRLAPVLTCASLVSIMGLRMLMRLGARLLGPVLPLFIQEIAPAGARIASITGIISGVSALAGAIGALGLGRLGDRVGYRKILVSCALGSAVCYMPQFFVMTHSWLIPLQAMTGLAMGGILASLSALLAQLSPPGQEGIVYGVDASIVSVANAVGPMAGSALAVWLGLRAPFLVAVGLFGLAGVVAARLLSGRLEG
ncbi:MAG: multidrug efflux MFS transporter [Chloroflexi bacterium]|nr:multidrug efflux MFS transporter [Chloroflexota bacterium]